jgi:MerR family transcriptional regulator, heat shock protein HspR
MGRSEGSKGPEPVPEDRAVYIISVAAELAGVHPQTLRIYERKGLLSPARTAGNTRRYSERDIARLRAIQRLTQEEGLNLAGVKMIVELENEVDRMRRRQEAIERELERARARLRDEIEAYRRRHPSVEIVPLSSVRRLGLRLAARQAFPFDAEDERRAPIAVGPSSFARSRSTRTAKRPAT